MDPKTREVAIASGVMIFFVLAFTLLACPSLFKEGKCGSTKPEPMTAGGDARDGYVGTPRRDFRENMTDDEDVRLHSFKLGGGQYLVVPDQTRVLASKEASVMVWITIPRAAVGPVVVMEKTGYSVPRAAGLTADMNPGQRVFELVEDEGSLCLTICDGSGAVAREVRVPSGLRDNQWHLVGVTIGGKHGARIYVDGSLQVSERGAPPLNTVLHPQALAVGMNTPSEIFASNLTYFDRELDQIMMSSFYNNGSPSDPRTMSPGLVAWVALQADEPPTDEMGNTKPHLVTRERQTGGLDLSGLAPVKMPPRAEWVPMPHSFVA